MPETTANPLLNARFERALDLALELHHKQLRKRARDDNRNAQGPEIPYFSHLMIVAGTVLDYGGTETEAAAALLHDAVEDQGGIPTLERIRLQLGEDVAGIVHACSDSVVEDDSNKEDWRPRKERYLSHLKEVDESVLIVSIADKLHNCRAVLRDYRREGDRLWRRFNAGREDQLWYYRSLAEVALHRGKGTRVEELAAEFARVVADLESEAGPQDGSGPLRQ